jgi:hypothetical protein
LNECELQLNRPIESRGCEMPQELVVEKQNALAFPWWIVLLIITVLLVFVLVLIIFGRK